MDNVHIDSILTEMIVEYNDEKFLINIESVTDEKVRIEIKNFINADFTPYDEIEIYDEVEHCENFSNAPQQAIRRLVELSETYAE